MPHRNSIGVFSCACKDKVWQPTQGVTGTEEEREMLANKGYVQAEDITGDIYYVGPYNRIIWLFADGTWRGDKIAEGRTLEAFLEDTSAHAATL